MSEDLYKIGTAAKRTGITPECLRAWERRYGFEPAARAGQTRFYNDAQVARLTSIRALLDQGHPISQVIHLSDEDLLRRLHPPRLQSNPGGAGQVGLVGGPLVLAYREAQGGKIEVAAEWASIAELRAERGALPKLDCLVAYLPTLDPQYIENIEECYPMVRVVVAFRYATAADLEHFRAAGYPLLRWPAEWAAVERIATAARIPDDTSPFYSDAELVHIGKSVSNAACQCPGDFVSLIYDLNACAANTHRCRGHEDHDAIRRDLAAVRAQLEQSLHALVEKHGLLAGDGATLRRTEHASQAAGYESAN